MSTVVDKQMIHCAHCKGYHPTIADVKECAATHNTVKVFENAPQALAREAAAEFSQQIQSAVHALQPEPLVQRLEREAAKAIGIAGLREGRYAIVVDGDYRFYRLEAGTGKWTGAVFVVREVSDDQDLKIYGKEAFIIKQRIALDPQEAMLAYGRELKRCGHCGRNLRNPESRRLGIGPVCRAAMGW
jgi:thiol-disulfide isomerase/thioredoxin